jgi:hypothetical protein
MKGPCSQAPYGNGSQASQLVGVLWRDAMKVVENKGGEAWSLT